MAQRFDYLKHMVLNFKVDLCCWISPVRVGLLIIAYINLMYQVTSLIGLSDDSFQSLITFIQDTILEDNAKKSIPVLAHIVDVAFTIVELCAIYRKDIPLMYLYQYYCIATVFISFLVYSMIVAAVGFIVVLTLIMNIVFQLYTLVLIRSLIVEMKTERRNQQVGSAYELQKYAITMSSLTTEPKEVKIEPVVETQSDSDESDETHQNGDKKDRLETVNEHPKEESSAEEERKEKK